MREKIQEHDEIKISFKLADPSGPALESVWAHVQTVHDEQTITVALDNVCFFLPMSLGDQVRAVRNQDGTWQVMQLEARRPGGYSWAIYLTDQHEVDSQVPPGDMTVRARAEIVMHRLRSRLTDPEKFNFEGAIPMLPLLVLTCLDPDPELLEAFTEELGALGDDHPTTVWLHTSPDDDLQAPYIIDQVDFQPLDPLPRISTSYQATTDPYWADKYGNTAELASLHDLVDELATTDPRCSTDLEAGRYDRVELLISRLLTDPEDLPELPEPIWPT